MLSLYIYIYMQFIHIRWYLFSWRHLNINSSLSFSYLLVFLYFVILFFSSRQKLHLLLKLLRVVDLLIKFRLTFGVRPLYFNFQNHLERVVWFLNEGLKNVYDYKASASNFLQKFQNIFLCPFYFPLGKWVPCTLHSRNYIYHQRGHSSLTLQLQNGLLKHCLSTHDFSINFFVMVANDFVINITGRITDFNCFPVKNFVYWVISIEMFIYEP